MKNPLFTTAGLAFSSITWAFTTQDPSFVPCEKTYISPHEVVLEKNTIRIETDDLSGTTSAIYLDPIGLYYQDLLEDRKEEPVAFEDFFEEDMFSIYSDERLPILTDEPLVLIPDKPLVIEKPLPISELAPIIQEEVTPSVVAIAEPIAQPELQPQQLQQQSSLPPSSWPYCDKKR